MKNIDKDFAVALWPILIGDKCKFMKLWIAFLEDENGPCKDKKIVKKDEWGMFL